MNNLWKREIHNNVKVQINRDYCEELPAATTIIEVPFYENLGILVK